MKCEARASSDVCDKATNLCGDLVCGVGLVVCIAGSYRICNRDSNKLGLVVGSWRAKGSADNRMIRASVVDEPSFWSSA